VSTPWETSTPQLVSAPPVRPRSETWGRGGASLPPQGSGHSGPLSIQACTASGTGAMAEPLVLLGETEQNSMVRVRRGDRYREGLGRMFVFAGALCFILTAGCSGPGRDTLRSAARSLVPTSATVVREVEGDCVELAPSPSCIHVYFVAGPVGLDPRVASVERRATEAGWDIERTERLPGGTQLDLRRGDLGATVHIRLAEERSRCGAEPRTGCADVILVEGEYGT
jgi:hypothetical protein